jgi:hypothetical protein
MVKRKAPVRSRGRGLGSTGEAGGGYFSPATLATSAA